MAFKSQTTLNIIADINTNNFTMEELAKKHGVSKHNISATKSKYKELITGTTIRKKHRPIPNPVIAELPADAVPMKYYNRAGKVDTSTYFITPDAKVYRSSVHGIRELKTSVSSAGYIQFAVNRTACLLHRAMACTFIPNSDYTLTVDHINRDKNHNTVDNLRWMTLRDNIAEFNRRVR